MSRSPSDPAYVPAYVDTQRVATADQDWQGTFRCMASDINVRIDAGPGQAAAAFDEIVTIFGQVERECTRFDPGSDLMRANAAAANWCAVGSYCFEALVAALGAHDLTDGRFDPRVLTTLHRLGYDRSLPFSEGGVEVGAQPPAEPVRAAWQPEFDATSQQVRIGPDPVDLGGIGKGLALRWAVAQVIESTPSFVLDAGGDCYLAGTGHDGAGWNVGVEDPFGGTEPAAVLQISDAACATSSIRLRHWTAGGAPVHHLIDPRTGAPGGGGLRAVTVVDTDPADAEVWTKVLFLEGADGIAAAAERHDVAAVWVADDRSLSVSDAGREYVIWQAS